MSQHLGSNDAKSRLIPSLIELYPALWTILHEAEALTAELGQAGGWSKPGHKQLDRPYKSECADG